MKFCKGILASVLKYKMLAGYIWELKLIFNRLSVFNEATLWVLLDKLFIAWPALDNDSMRVFAGIVNI